MISHCSYANLLPYACTITQLLPCYPLPPGEQPSEPCCWSPTHTLPTTQTGLRQDRDRFRPSSSQTTPLPACHHWTCWLFPNPSHPIIVFPDCVPLVGTVGGNRWSGRLPLDRWCVFPDCVGGSYCCVLGSVVEEKKRIPQ